MSRGGCLSGGQEEGVTDTNGQTNTLPSRQIEVVESEHSLLEW